MKKYELKASVRKDLKKRVKVARRNGQLPAVVYGAVRGSENVYVDEESFLSVFREAEHSNLIDLTIGNDKMAKVIVREVQRKPVTNEIIHVSFFEIDKNSMMNVAVPVEVVGTSPAVKNNIGIMINPIGELEVRCLPSNIPSKLIVDISKLDTVGMAIKISDVELPKGAEWVYGTNMSENVCYIVAPQKEEVKVVEEAEVEDGEEGESEEGEEKEEAKE